MNSWPKLLYWLGGWKVVNMAVLGGKPLNCSPFLSEASYKRQRTILILTLHGTLVTHTPHIRDFRQGGWVLIRDSGKTRRKYGTPEGPENSESTRNKA